VDPFSPCRREHVNAPKCAQSSYREAGSFVPHTNNFLNVGIRPLPSFVRSYPAVRPIPESRATNPALVNRCNRPQQFVVSLRTIQQQRAQHQQLPFAANKLDRFFHGALHHRYDHIGY
jgi:hypothetical protein